MASWWFEIPNSRKILGQMSNVFYEAGSLRAQRVGDLFAAIAERYDLINDLQSFGLHRRWKHRLARLAKVKPGELALDLCCGTGDVTFALAQEGAAVTGLDFSDSMLTVARRRLQAMNAGGPGSRASLAVTFLRGDAQQLPFPDASFDIVTVAYGLRNLVSYETGLREMKRIAKPRARLLVLDFGKPRNRFWRGLYYGYLRMFVPLLGRLVCGNAAAYAYILESLKHYPAQQGVAAQMRELGLVNVRIQELLLGAMSINYAELPAGSPSLLTLA